MSEEFPLERVGGVLLKLSTFYIIFVNNKHLQKMCEAGKALKFCTCLEVKDKELINMHKRLDKFYKKVLPKTKEPFSWVLYEYKGRAVSFLDGLLHQPSDKIGSSLTEEFVLYQLNSKNCFDFDYAPKEGDNLQVNFQRNKYWTEFLSFIFRDNKWETDSYSGFKDSIEAKNYGILKVDK